MGNLADIKYRMKGVADTRQITKAMETVSIAKMRKAMQSFKANAEFFAKIVDTISDIALHSGYIDSAYMNRRLGHGRVLYVIIASDKGLCASYNHNILELAKIKILEKEIAHLEAKTDDQLVAHMQGGIEQRLAFIENKISIFTVGHIATTFFEKLGINIDMEYSHISTESTLRDAKKIAEDIKMLYDMNLVDEVNVLYTQIDHHGTLTPTELPLLPLKRDEILQKILQKQNAENKAANHYNQIKDYQNVNLGETGKNENTKTPQNNQPQKSYTNLQDEEYFKELEYDPSVEEVLETLIVRYLNGALYGALVQSSAAEHSSRRTAMSNATNNALEILDKLNLEYNRERQASVTNEILEIITASNVAQGK